MTRLLYPRFGNSAALAPAPFAPDQIAGLKLWLKADTGLYQDAGTATPSTADGDPVRHWVDLSGQGNDLSQATSSKRPTLKLAVQNGRSVVRFDGVDDLLVSSVYTLGQPLLLAGAFKHTWAPGQPYLYDAANTFDQATIFDRVTSGSLLPFAGTTGTDLPYTSGTFAVLNILYNGTSSKYRLNGTADTTADLGTIGQNGLTLGNRQTGTFPSAADWGEILVYSGNVSDANRALLDAYLNTRWGAY